MLTLNFSFPKGLLVTYATKRYLLSISYIVQLGHKPRRRHEHLGVVYLNKALSIFFIPQVPSGNICYQKLFSEKCNCGIT